MNSRLERLRINRDYIRTEIARLTALEASIVHEIGEMILALPRDEVAEALTRQRNAAFNAVNLGDEIQVAATQIAERGFSNE